MGYTPDRVVGVWMGNSDGTPMAEGTFSAGGAGPIWRQIMEAAHEGVEVHEFTVPEGVVFQPCAGRNEAFVEGTTCDLQPTRARAHAGRHRHPSRQAHRHPRRHARAGRHVHAVAGTPGATPIATPAPTQAPAEPTPTPVP